MQNLNEKDIMTKVVRYNLIREQRLVYIDVHEAIFGELAGKYVAVPNLVNIVAKQEFQGVGETEENALDDCLKKIQSMSIDKLFPEKPAHLSE